MDTAQMPIIRWMVTENVVYSYNKVLVNLKKEEIPDICDIMG